VKEIEGLGEVFFFYEMDRQKFQEVITKAAAERSCTVVMVDFNDDDNVFEVVLDKDGEESVNLDDCEYVHRAVLDAFDRNIEDYALTVGSAGLDAAEADEILKTINE